MQPQYYVLFNKLLLSVILLLLWNENKYEYEFRHSFILLVAMYASSFPSYDVFNRA